MSFPLATPLPSLDSKQGTQPTPAELYNFLRNLLSNIHPGGKPEQFLSYVTLLSSLTENFLARFPQPSLSRWAVHEDIIKLTACSLEVVEKIVERIHGALTAKEGVARALLLGLCHLSWSLDVWAMGHRDSADDFISPGVLRDRARVTAVMVMRTLGNTPKAVSHKGTLQDWRILQEVLEEYLEAAKEIVTSRSIAFPQKLVFFSKPRLQPLSTEDPFDDAPHNGQFIFKKNLHATKCVVALVHQVAHALRPATLSQSFMEIQLRNAIEFTSSCVEWLVRTPQTSGHQVR
ncbi:hypothetical protein SISSUDRAFT_797308 [Sistotremastrum suecicum HHB10207 ss-3]|uniref:Uncharacterized protein n=1 Tax=Sistotremastrum suecicum HHB10207 ss-3 TaxID=1314776 RepID=A0A166HPT5_9AGAM|nr:hypothetical protein SISSUDRAFT_797308 [Sistotremastrum suecicum HHB10207 ss-3]